MSKRKASKRAKSTAGHKPVAVACTRLLDTDPVAFLLATLTEREATIITLRFGLEDGIERYWEETAKQFKITRERARQIALKALRKMREYSEAVEELRMLVVSNPTGQTRPTDGGK